MPRAKKSTTVIKMKSTQDFTIRPDDGHKWMSSTGRQLKDGDILRTPRDEKNYADPWLYGVCSGGGFGCNPDSLGNAVFMHCEAINPEACIQYAKCPDNGNGDEILPLPIAGILHHGGRWERFWLIEVLVE